MRVIDGRNQRVVPGEKYRMFQDGQVLRILDMKQHDAGTNIPQNLVMMLTS